MFYISKPTNKSKYNLNKIAMINIPILRNFRASEFIQFCKDVLSLCKKADPKKLQIDEPLSDFEASTVKLDDIFKVSKASGITQVLSKLDDRRDEGVICYRKLSDGYTHHFNAEKADAGEKLIAAIDNYGSNIYKLN